MKMGRGQSGFFLLSGDSGGYGEGKGTSAAFQEAHTGTGARVCSHKVM